MQLDFSVRHSPFHHFGLLAAYQVIWAEIVFILQIYNTLLVDKNHQSPAAAQAASNILRGTLAAITVSFVQNMIDKLGIGWTFTLMGGLCVVATGLFAIDYCQGFSWRRVHVSDSSKR